MTALVVTGTCPINPDCLCTCGTYAGDHGLVDHPVDPAPGEDPACQDTSTCHVCDQLVCDTHDADTSQCVDVGGGRHHDECTDRCMSCAREIAAERWAEQDADARCP